MKIRKGPAAPAPSDTLAALDALTAAMIAQTAATLTNGGIKR